MKIWETIKAELSDNLWFNVGLFCAGVVVGVVGANVV